MRGEALQEVRARAREALVDAKALLRSGSPEAAINRAYYAAFYAASALLTARGVSAKSHQGVVDLLHGEFVRSAEMDRDLVRQYSDLYELRLSSDYGPFARATPEAASHAVQWASSFLDVVEDMLGRGAG